VGRRFKYDPYLMVFGTSGKKGSGGARGSAVSRPMSRKKFFGTQKKKLIKGELESEKGEGEGPGGGVIGCVFVSGDQGSKTGETGGGGGGQKKGGAREKTIGENQKKKKRSVSQQKPAEKKPKKRRGEIGETPRKISPGFGKKRMKGGKKESRKPQSFGGDCGGLVSEQHKEREEWRRENQKKNEREKKKRKKKIVNALPRKRGAMGW